MGYLENMLPKYLSRLGAEVHVIASDLLPYYWSVEDRHAFGGFSCPPTAGAVTAIDGYTLHVLPHVRVAGYMRMRGLRKTLRDLHPDVVQVLSPVGWGSLEAFLYKSLYGYRLFTGCHMTASAFALLRTTGMQRVLQNVRSCALRYLPGKIISCATERCYAVTEDCAAIAIRYFGVQQSKVDIAYLGVDAEYFRPLTSASDDAERRETRNALGFSDEEIVCIYTGKFTAPKKVQLLADAVERLREQGLPYRAMFIGGGPDARVLEGYAAAVTLPPMDFRSLAPYYRAADIAVWPGTESTSMLDAVACGLPLVISDQVFYRAPVEGNGRVFQRDKVSSLVSILRELGDSDVRTSLGRKGASRMAAKFTWEVAAARKLQDYQHALNQVSEGESRRRDLPVINREIEASSRPPCDMSRGVTGTKDKVIESSLV
jgi:glycosyltransferase involved in cell wall biosynthesis